MTDEFEYDDGPVIDFKGFSELLHMYLPKLKKIYHQYMRTSNFVLKTPLKLEEIHIMEPTMVDREWTLDLPTLTTLMMQNHSPPPKKFAESIINCPNIETYASHKYWPLEKIPKLYFPNCKKFTFRRGDSLEALSVYLPKVNYVNVDACYGLDRLTLLKRGHAKT
eukprot:UN27217